MHEARFEALVRAVGEPLHRYLVRRTDPDTADDVLADTMLVLWRRIDDVPHLDDVLPWCYGVARGCLANARRAEKRRLRLVDRLAHKDPVTEPAEHTDLYDALRTLGEMDREIVMLWAWEGLGPQDIAAVTGLTSNAVSIRLHRAKKKLAHRLDRKTSPASGQEQVKKGSEQ